MIRRKNTIRSTNCSHQKAQRNGCISWLNAELAVTTRVGHGDGGTGAFSGFRYFCLWRRWRFCSILILSHSSRTYHTICRPRNDLSLKIVVRT